MRRTPMPPPSVAFGLGLVLFAGCSPAPTTPSHRGVDGISPPATTVTTTQSPALPAQGGDAAPEDHLGPGLSPDRKSLLGVPALGASPSDLAPLSGAQWADPEAVAARYVLVDTNYSSAEDPAALDARRAQYAGERLRADLGASSSAGAGLGQLRASHTVFHGEILGVSTSELTDGTAVVVLTVRTRVSSDGDAAPPPRVGFAEVTMVRDTGSGRWYVVHVASS